MALALFLLAAPRAWAGPVEVRAELDLHVRFSSLVFRPSTDVLYDPARRAFALEAYLEPTQSDRHGSTSAAVRLEASALGGDLVLRLAADTGEVRRRTFPELQDVCLTLSGTGLAEPRSPACALSGFAIVPLETTVAGPVRLTSNGRPVGDEARATWLVRELSATLSTGRAGFARLTAGRRRVSVGDGLVHDDDSAVAGLSLDLGAVGPPFLLDARVLAPSREWPVGGTAASPMAAVELSWLPSLFESVGVFAAVMRDRTGSVAEALRGQNVERSAVRLARAQAEPGITLREREAAYLLAGALATEYRSEATLVWLGTSGGLSPWRGQRLSFTAAALEGEVSSISVPLAVLVRDVALHGRAARVAWDVDLPAALSAGASFLWLSGGTFPVASYQAGQLVPGTGEYGGFLGVRPFIPHTNLFFGGGLTDTFAARESTAPGVNGRGVLSPAVRLAFDPSERGGIEAKVAWLRADVTGPFGGKTYGWEVDLGGSLSPAPWLDVALELDVLWPGDFYAARDRAYKAVLAVELHTP
jgi:hypothetical protein